MSPAPSGSAALPFERRAVAITSSMPLRRLWWAALFLLGISASAVGWTIWQLRTDAIHAAITESGNIATVLAGQLSRSVQGIDRVLLEVKRASRDLDIDMPRGFREAFNRRAFRETLLDHLSRLPQAFNIVIADQLGQVTVSTAAWPTPDINVTDRDYFQDARTRTDGQLSMSVPIYNRINGKQTIVFARRLESATGDFVGIIFCSVSTEYFEAIYGSIQAVHAHQFELRKPNGTILARHPGSNDAAEQKNEAGPQWHEAVAGGAGGYSDAKGLDGDVSFRSVRTVPEYPLVVDVSVTESAALEGWRQQAATIGIGSTVLLLCSIYLLLAVTRQVRCLSDSEASLTQKSQQLDAALNNMSQGLSMFDAQRRLIICNRQYNELYGLTAEQTKPGTPFRAILDARIASGNAPEDVESYIASSLENIGRQEPSCIINELRDGRIISITHQIMRNGGRVAIHQDITAQKRAETELAHMARYDGLTGLANRALFMEQANAALARMRDHGGEFAVLMLDLDRFKTVNDSLGHPVGDSLLKMVAQRLLQILPEVDTVARLGGDEFAILQSMAKDQRNTVTGLADRLLTVVTQPYELDDRRVTVETSIGITFAPRDGTDADSLLKNADIALYKAKAQGGNKYCLFEPAMEAQVNERRELEEDMRKAISRNEFELYYQTVVDTEKRAYCGAEALVRWHHPVRGLIVLPERFITLAEESGLIVPLGEWILRQACAEATKWPSHLKVAVNLSPAQFRQGNLLSLLKSVLAECQLPPERLELEITETVLLEKNEEYLAVLHELKRLGVAIVLDDFGIGYSSMRYLQMFPFDKIKIDKSFIQSMTSHADSAAIVCAMAGLGRALEIETCAEGVETAEQFTFLRAAGCQLAQGFLFSRPVPASEIRFERSDALPGTTKAA